MCARWWKKSGKEFMMEKILYSCGISGVANGCKKNRRKKKVFTSSSDKTTVA